MYEPQEVLVFDLIGPMAHFRNIETNSTSLSYSFPPPTTIRGIIAAILGLERDSYYEILSDEKSFVVVQCKSIIRKSIQTLNYQTYKKEAITQIPLEIIIPQNKDEEIIYRVFIALEDKTLQSELEQLVSNHNTRYPISFGLASFLCSTQYVGKFKITKVPTDQQRELQLTILTLDANILEVIDWGSNAKLFYEKVRKNYGKDREPGDMVTLVNLVEGTIKIRVKSNVYDIKIDNTSQTIVRY